MMLSLYGEQKMLIAVILSIPMLILYGTLPAVLPLNLIYGIAFAIGLCVLHFGILFHLGNRWLPA